jgi:prepilin-type N-terminal cleavage/methylation domain-containing protein
MNTYFKSETKTKSKSAIRNIKTVSNLQEAFTIVELLVVIVVIGILAAITILSYIGISNRAVATSIESDLSNSSNKLKAYSAVYGSYPTTLNANCPTAPNSDSSFCLKASNGASYISYKSDGNRFILIETNSSNAITYKITDNSSPVVYYNYTGVLATLSPSSKSVGAFPHEIVNSSDGKSVYVVNEEDSTISMFSRNTSTGQLTTLSPATITTGLGSADYGQHIAISPDGKSVYVTSHYDNTISIYNRDTGTGQLTPSSPATVNAGVSLCDIAISPDGKSVYIGGGSGILVASRNTSTGALSSLTASVAANFYSIIAISPDGSSVYIASGNTISMYSRDTNTGQLTALSTPTISSGPNVENIIVSPDNVSVYTANNDNNTISMYGRNTSTGQLTALSPATIQCGSSGYTLYGLAISPDGTSLYAADSSSPGSVWMFQRDEITGRLTALSPTNLNIGSQPLGITITSDNKSVYVTSADNSLVFMLGRS